MGNRLGNCYWKSKKNPVPYTKIISRRTLWSKPVKYFCFCPPSLVLQIVAAVVSHERALKAQAKKMNVDSLRSNKVRIESKKCWEMKLNAFFW